MESEYNEMMWFGLLAIFLLGGLGLFIFYGAYIFIQDYRQDKDRSMLFGAGMLFMLGMACMSGVIMGFVELFK